MDSIVRNLLSRQMNSFLSIVARSALAILLLASSGITHCEEDRFVRWASTHAVPLVTLEFNAEVSDLLPLKSAVGTARVVALGEPLHGAHEPAAFRNRLFRFLVEQMGFTAIALEWGFTEAIALNSFTEDGQGDVESAALKKDLGTTENLQLIRWMRGYNAAASLAGHGKIRLYGIDLTRGARMGAPRRAIEYALTYLSKADAATAQKIAASVADNLPRSDNDEFGPVSTAALAGYGSRLNAIATAMRTNRTRLIARSSDEEYRRALHNLDVARQVAKCLPLTPPASAAGNVWEAAIGCRDAAMAENVQWALATEAREGRLLVFAHNGHAWNYKWPGPRTSRFQEPVSMMGVHLRRMYGDGLYIISTSSVMTSGDLPRPKPIEDSIDDALARVGPAKMFLDLRTARQDPAAYAWLSQPRPLNANLGHYNVVAPSATLDAFIFLRELTPAGEIPGLN